MNEEKTPKPKAINIENPSTMEDTIPSDKEIKSRIEFLFLLCPLLDSDSIDIEVSDRLVLLKGSVDAFWKKRKVKILSKNTKGVLRVKDALDIIPPRNYPDEEIARELESTLIRRPVVSPKDVDIRVSNGEVTLEGRVPNWFTYSQVKMTSENTLGVVNIIDRMKIES